MTAEDAPPVALLSGQLGYPSEAHEIRRRLEELAGKADSAAFVAEGGDSTILGWLHVAGRRFLESEPNAEVLALVVDANRRRKGVGRALLAAAERWAVEHGYARIRVRSNILREESRPFYLGLGYEIVKTQHVYQRKIP